MVNKNYTATSTSTSTATIIENYEYYGDYGDDGDDEQSETDAPRSAIEWFDARTRNRRDIENNPDDMETITYRVCVRLVTAHLLMRLR